MKELIYYCEEVRVTFKNDCGRITHSVTAKNTSGSGEDLLCEQMYDYRYLAQVDFDAKTEEMCNKIVSKIAATVTNKA